MIANHKFYAVVWKMKYIPSDYRLVMENGRPIIFDTLDKALDYAHEKFNNSEHACATTIETILIYKGI